jgi:hypothetical protein
VTNYQLRRYLMREVHGVDILRKSPSKASLLGTPKTARSWRYLAWIRTLPCACCGQDPAGEAAHTGSDGGTSLKASDYSAVPLCSHCHTMSSDSYHALGRDEFELRHGLDLAGIVKRLNRLWFHPENRIA